MGSVTEAYHHVLGLANFGSIHGLHHALYASFRAHLSKALWVFLVLFFCSLCCYLQVSLLYEILVRKPILVKSEVDRVDSINFPNVVVCDLNNENDKFQEYINLFGNSGEMHRLLIQLSKLDLFQDFRGLVQQNITRALQKYPVIAQQYHTYNQKCDKAYLEQYGQTSVFDTP